ncbi:Dabb family protein [Puniceicoccaceae bacterium K14]|nr:Dabb family protein [Puniceicoccaceae bacterium K14]
MLVHSVYFYFKSDASEQQRKDCMEAAKGLGDIEGAVAYYVGTPASVPDRPPLVKDYDFGLTGVFESVEKHDAYQVHPIHKEFIESYKPIWEKVVVYDFD